MILVVKLITLLLITFSLGVTFYVKVVEGDYIIFDDPDGPDVEEYMIEMGLYE